MRKLVAQRERWQRVILETWWSYRHMCFDRRYGSVGLLGMPFYLLSEIVAPLFEILAIATLLAGAVAGLVDWQLFAIVTLLVSLANSVFSAGALVMVDQQERVYRPRGLLRLLALMPVELLVYRADHGVGADQGHLAVPLAVTKAGTSSSATSGWGRHEARRSGAPRGRT